MTMTEHFRDRFCGALRIKTDWPPAARPGDAVAEAPLVRFQEFLVESYPAFHRCAERWVLSPYAVVYRWPGEDTPGEVPPGEIPPGENSLGENSSGGKSPGADPALFLAHYDVVPVEAGKWSVDPFGAELKDGYVYGRGALDMKCITMAIMESAEGLCESGFKPRRDIWIALGGDEERCGIFGAMKTAAWFRERNLRFSFIIDEGTPVVRGQIKGIDKPLALVGIEEKGYLNAALSVEQKPGHASQPPERQAAAILARALLRLSRRPFPWHLTAVVEAFFRRLGPHAAGPAGWVMKHARLLGPLFFKAAAAGPATRALLRTTMAMTQLEGSSADNVLPSTVRAVLNLRLLPPWTVDTAIKRIRSIIADNRVSVTVHGLGSDPVMAGLETAAMTGPGWNEISAAIAAAFTADGGIPGEEAAGLPGLPALPFLMLATTDSRHFEDLSPGIFRFSPQTLTPEEISRVHGHDERISLENLEHCLRFYTALMEQL
ncbi:MAG: M20/M25/M40 family metallo-hydrolase [Treponema sp.]|jgi:carboxypeptidase PM20D1|nr:M20/M25/M40 family metallo-hydrolase [Treponema sp.]